MNTNIVCTGKAMSAKCLGLRWAGLDLVYVCVCLLAKCTHKCLGTRLVC